MSVSTERVNQVLKTLPIGYYIGREVEIELNEDDATSSYDVLNDKIYVSTNNVISSLSGLENVDDETFENCIRAILYHELSHALLTPKTLFGHCWSSHDHFLVNVVEDERIETVTKDLYYGVDFKSSFKRIYESTYHDSCIDELFIRFVRFREGDQDLLDKLDDLIKKYEKLSRNDNKYEELANYVRDIVHLFDLFEKRYSSESPESNESGSEDSGEEETSGDSSDKDSESNADDNSQSSQKVLSTANSSSESEDLINTEDLDEFESTSNSMKRLWLSDVFKKISSEYVNQDLIDSLESIFISHNKVKSMGGSGSRSYSGVFDPRAAGRDDYRYFVHKNDRGSVNSFSKIHLNLFLDRSGSFYRNVEQANQILYALSFIERKYKDFDYTLITCGIGETIEDKKNFIYSAYDGTSISHEIFDTFREVQSKNALNFNIVLYDGLAYDSSAKKDKDGYIGNFEAFNTRNTLIITDPDNEKAVSFCPEARVVISKDYCNELESNLVKTLEIMVKNI